MNNLEALIRPNIKALTPYSSARDEFAGEGYILLDANENPYGEHNRYPDPYQRELKAKIAALKTVDPEQVFIGNGSDQVIDLLLRVFCKPQIDCIASFDPSYGMYQVSAQINDVALLKIPLNQDFSINQSATLKVLAADKVKMLFVCNPNNPSGTLYKREQIKWLLNNFNGIVVIDEAYIDFCPEASSLNFLEQYPNLIVMQTLSKAWGLAGLRIGMAFASPEIITYLNKVKPPYNVSSINQQAALEALNNQQLYLYNIALIMSEKQRLQTQLRSITIVEKIYPSASNFLLIEVKKIDQTFKSLKNQQLVVRNRHSARANCLRITVGSPSENDKLIEVLRNLS